jgi:hypothetical protein
VVEFSFFSHFFLCKQKLSRAAVLMKLFIMLRMICMGYGLTAKGTPDQMVRVLEPARTPILLGSECRTPSRFSEDLVYIACCAR